MKRGRNIRGWLLGGLCLAIVYAALQWGSFGQIVRAGPNLYWDTDPYSRMYRVGSILEGHGWMIPFQNVDGYPEGHGSHWTLPFDAWCAVLAKVTSLPVAGQLASPLLGLACLLGLAAWCFRNLPRPIAWATTLVYLFQPAFHWTTALGRPDHQSLAHLCLLMAVLTDLGFWLRAPAGPPLRSVRWTVLVNGLALGVGIWTTVELALLWLVQFAVALGLAAALRREDGWRLLGQRAAGWAVTVAVIFIAFGLECRFDPTQIRVGDFRDETLRRWFGVVQEFQPLLMVRGEWRFSALHGLFGLSFYLAPVLAWFFVRSRRFDVPFKVALGTSTVVYTALAFAQIHWVAPVALLWPLFAAVGVIASVDSRRWSLAPSPTLYAMALGILFLPCVRGFVEFAQRDELGVRLKPVCEWIRQNTPHNEDLERFSPVTPQHGPYSILTQWWQGSYVLYLARRPVVATPYHTNMEAITDAYRFLVATSWAEAEEILQRRRCRYVLLEDRRLFVEDAQRVLADGRIWIEFRTREAPDGTHRRAFRFTPLFYETMFYRLQVLNGGGLPLRLVHESRERSEYDRTQARFKVFEYTP